MLGWVQAGCSEQSGFEVGYTSAAEHVERHRSLVVHDLPGAVELPEAERDPDPDALGRRPVHQRAMEPAEAVPERQVIAHCDVQAAHDQQTLSAVPGIDELARAALPLQFLASPEDYTGHYVQLASRANARATTGEVISCDGGLRVRGLQRPTGGGQQALS